MAWNAVSNLPVGWTGWMSYKQWYQGFGSMPAWKYGLVGATAAHCGALPFRWENDGLNAGKCLRGEDWAFIYSVQASSVDLPDPYIWNFNRPSTGVINTQVRKSLIQQAYNWLKAFEAQQCWGDGFNWPAGGKYAWHMGWSPDYGFPAWTGQQQIYSTLKGMLVNPMVVTMLDPSTQSNKLDIHNMDLMFDDYKKLNITVTSLGDGSIQNACQLANDGTSTTVVNNFVMVTFKSRQYTGLPTDQKIGLVVPYLIFDITLYQTCTDSSGSTEIKANHRMLVPMVPTVDYQMETFQNEYSRYQLQFDNHPDGRISGRDVLQSACQILGVPEVWVPPSVPQGSTRMANTTMTIQNVYIPCQNQWLVNY